MREGEFRELVEVALEQHPELAGMEETVGKELLHYELVHVLNRGGWLDRLTFKGSAALRLCYGASHLSEGLEFSGGPNFSAESIDGLAAYLKETLSDRGFGVEVKSPKAMNSFATSGSGVSGWRIVFETLPIRRGFPKRRFELNIDNAAIYTKSPGAIAQNYNVARESRMIVHVQSKEEIFASKLVEFSASVATRNRPPYRDIWDMYWLTGIGTKIRNDLVRAKMADHHVDSAWFEIAADRVGDIVRSTEFVDELRRILLPHTIAEVLDNPLSIEFIAEESEQLIRMAYR